MRGESCPCGPLTPALSPATKSVPQAASSAGEREPELATRQRLGCTHVPRCLRHTTPRPIPTIHGSFMSLSPLTSVPAAVDFPSTASPDAVARQVEGLFASLLLKEMRGNGREGGLFGGDSSDVLGGMFDQYMGQAIADAGGLGLRDYLVDQARTSTETPTSSETL